MAKRFEIPKGATVRKVNLGGLSKAQKKAATQSELEIALGRSIEFYAKSKGLPLPVAEYVFAKEFGRFWRLDFAFPDLRIGVEVHGGTFTGGAHSRGGHQSSDFEKFNVAAREGWLILQFDTVALRPKNIMSSIALIYATIAKTQLRKAAGNG